MKKRLLLLSISALLLSTLYLDLFNVRSIVLATTSGWAISGDNVYFNDGNVGIGTVSPSALLEIKAKEGASPDNIQFKSVITHGVGGYSWMNNPWAVKAVDNYLYIYSNNHGLTIVDVTDPANPIKKSETWPGKNSSFNYIGQGKGIDVVGDYAYLVSGHSQNGFTILDISDPTDPVLESEVYDGDGEFSKLQYGSSVKVVGNYAYVTAEGLTIIDISDKTDPDLQSDIWDGDGEFSLLAGIKQVDVQSGYAYMVSSNDSSLTIADISDPTDPVLESEVYDGDGEFSKLSYPENLVVDGDYAYVVSKGSDNALTIIDITDPSDPDLVAEVWDGDGEFSRLNSPEGIAKSGNYLFISADNSITIVDVSNPSDPQLVDEITDGEGSFTNISSPRKIAVSGDTLFLGTYSSENSVTIANFDSDDIHVFNAHNSGKVGIGTNDPKASLDINGAMKLKKNSSAPFTCDSDTDGSLALNSAYRLCTCKSASGWVYTSDGSTTCSW